MAKASGGSGKSGGAKRSGGKGSSGKGASAKKALGKRASGKRELINTGTDKRFVRRGSGGQFKESDDVGKSLASDRRKKAKTVAKSGQGDRGDHRR